MITGNKSSLLTLCCEVRAEAGVEGALWRLDNTGVEGGATEEEVGVAVVLREMRMEVVEPAESKFAI